MKHNIFTRAILLVMLISLLPMGAALALTPANVPPPDMFQLPWDLGIAWYAIDGIDNGNKRPLTSSHNYSVGGAIDFGIEHLLKDYLVLRFGGGWTFSPVPKKYLDPSLPDDHGDIVYVQY